jgi:diguanylate cyclase (GGDEF)-like protein/PAS domain S-box-containing protein
MEHSPDRIYFKDLQSRIVYGNPSYARLFGGITLSQILGKTDYDFFSDHHARTAFEDEQEIIRTGVPKLNMEEMETWPDGRITWCSTSKAPLRNDEGKIVGTLGVSRDMTQQKLTQEALKKSEADYRRSSQELAVSNRQLAEANRALQELSFKDPLTHLWNRRFLMDQIPEDIALAARAHRNLSDNGLDRMKQNVDILFAMVDIDHFKEVNDRFGHLAGDLVLQQMGEVLRGAARTSDMVARVGGEEFLIVARQMARSDSNVVAERIRSSVASHPFRLDENTTISLTCSVGFSVYPLFATELKLFSWEQIVEIADHCLYAAKNSGRDAWVGIIPDAARPRDGYGILPKDLAELVRSGILPTISSVRGPLNWQ